MHQDAVAGGHPTTYDKPEPGRHKGHGQRGGFFDTQVIRLPDDQAGLRGYVSRHGRRHHAHDQIARVYVTDLIAPRDYFSDAFPSEGRRTRRRDLQHAEGGQYVPEVQSGGANAYDHFIGCRPGCFRSDKMEIFNRTGYGLRQPVTCF